LARKLPAIREHVTPEQVDTHPLKTATLFTQR
jgi:hypothetical protein